MVGAGRVAADSDSADEGAITEIQRQTSAKDVDSPNSLTDHGVIVGSDEVRVTAISNDGIDRITLLQPEKAAPGLYRRKEVRGGQRKARKAESVGRVGFLS